MCKIIVNETDYYALQRRYPDMDMSRYEIIAPLEFYDCKEDLSDYEEPIKWDIVKNISKSTQVLNKKPINNPIQGRSY